MSVGLRAVGAIAIVACVAVYFFGSSLMGCDGREPQLRSSKPVNPGKAGENLGKPVHDVVCRAYLKDDGTRRPANEPIVLVCDTKASSPESGEVFLSNPYGVYTWRVIGPDGKDCSQTCYGEKIMAGSDGFHSHWKQLEVGEKNRCFVNINYLFDMTLPGEYRFRFSRKVRKEGHVQVVHSNEITIDVTFPEPSPAEYEKVLEEKSRLMQSE